MNQEITYTQVGDYLLPDIRLVPEPVAPPLGRYARMRRAFQKEHCPIQYSRLVLSEQLFPHLRKVDAIADIRRASGTPEGIIIKEIVCELYA